MVPGKENVDKFVSCRVAPSVIIPGDPESQNCFRFVLLLRFRFAQKVRDRPSPFFSPAGRPTGVDDSYEIGLLSLKGRCHGNKFSSFSDISAGADAIFVMLRSQSFDLFYSGKLVVDSFRIVELLQICQGLVVQLVVNLL